MELHTIVEGFAAALMAADRRRPVAVNMRSGQPYQPGIGPHGEVATIQIVTSEWKSGGYPELSECQAPVRYQETRQSCDLCLGAPPDWAWAIEVKLLRMLGDNAKPNDNMLMHLLSPYAAHRSALTDCQKLASQDLGRRRALLVYGYDYDSWPLAPAIEAFETLAAQRVQLGDRISASFDRLVHPIHRRGAALAWEVARLNTP